jgi:uncharacterized protein YuzE
MKLNYYPEIDSLYIDLSERTSVESREVSEGGVLDYVPVGNPVGIDIDNAGTKSTSRSSPSVCPTGPPPTTRHETPATRASQVNRSQV